MTSTISTVTVLVRPLRPYAGGRGHRRGRGQGGRGAVRNGVGGGLQLHSITYGMGSDLTSPSLER